MHRFGLFAVLGALCGLALPAHAQAPYEPPAVGQTYVYKDWQCAVTAVDGMATRCRLADGRDFVLYAGIEPVGEGAPRPLDALRRLSCGGNAATIESYALDDEARAALAALWPLAVGNAAQYRIGLVLAFGPAGRNSPQIPVRAEVAGRETVAVGGTTYDTFVIRQEVKGTCRRAGARWAYIRTLHYAPALRAVVREEVRWTAGDDKGRSGVSELTAAPAATAVAAAAPQTDAKAAPAAPPAAATPSPPARRPASDVTAVLDQESPDPARIAALRERAAARIDGRGPERVKALFDRAIARIDLSRNAEALADLTAALDIARNAAQRDQILSLLVLVESQAGNVRTALGYAEQRVREAEKIGRFGAPANLVDAYVEAGEIEKAEKLIAGLQDELTATIARGQNNEALDAMARFPVHAAQSRVLEATGRYPEAEDALGLSLAALDRALELSDVLHRPVETLQAAHIGLQVRRARLKLRQGNATEAEVLARGALGEALRVRGKYHAQTALAALMLQRAILEQGRYADSGALARAAVGILEGIGIDDSARTMARARLRVAESFAAAAAWSDAAAVYDRVRADLANDAETAHQVFGDDLLYALTLYHGGRPADGRRAAAEVYETRRNRLGERHYMTALARGVAAVGLVDSDPAAALADFAAAVPVILSPSRRAEEEDGGRSAQALQERFVLESWLALLARIEGTTQAAQVPGGPAAEAFRIADALRAQAVQKALAASSARAAARDPALAALVREEQDAQRGIGALLGQLADLLALPPAQRPADVIAALETRVDALRDSRAAARERIEARFPDYVRLVDPRPATIADAEAVLRPGEALIATYVGDAATYVWALAPGKAPAFQRVALGRTDLLDRVGLLRVALDPGPVEFIADVPPFDTAAAHDLYRNLLAPLRGVWGDAASLQIVAHGPLGQIPFALLTTADFAPPDTDLPFAGYRGAPWLLRDHAVTVLPSVAALAALRDLPPARAARRPFVGFGDPAFVLAADAVPAASPLATRGAVRLRNLPPDRGAMGAGLADLPPLPDTAAEVRSIADALRADPARDVFTGAGASERAVKTAALADYRVVVFATHGLVPGDLDGLDQPALALAAPAAGEDDDGLLTMGEVFELRMDADWVVLSACNTASAGGGAEAFSGLGRAFFYAGTRAMLLSNWPVESVSARLLTTDVFRRQAEDPGLGRAEALRRAMLALIDDGVARETAGGAPLFSYAHPMFWAPFSLVGEGG